MRMSVQRFRKKPVEVEASQWDGTKESAEAIVAWITSQGGDAQYINVRGLTNTINISTLEGEMHALEYDWIIRGVKGEFYPCKPDIFDQTYDAAEGMFQSAEGDPYLWESGS